MHGPQLNVFVAKIALGFYYHFFFFLLEAESLS